MLIVSDFTYRSADPPSGGGTVLVPLASLPGRHRAARAGDQGPEGQSGPAAPPENAKGEPDAGEAAPEEGLRRVSGPDGRNGGGAV